MFIHFELPWCSLPLFGFLHFEMSYFVGIVKVCRSQSHLIVSILSSHTYIHTILFAIFVVCSLSPHPFESQLSILKSHRIQSSPNCKVQMHGLGCIVGEAINFKRFA